MNGSKYHTPVGSIIAQRFLEERNKSTTKDRRPWTAPFDYFFYSQVFLVTIPTALLVLLYHFDFFHKTLLLFGGK